MEKLKNMLDEVTVSRIATLNDAFRKAGIGYMLTGGVQTVTNLMGLLQAIKDYDNFNEDNDHTVNMTSDGLIGTVTRFSGR